MAQSQHTLKDDGEISLGNARYMALAYRVARELIMPRAGDFYHMATVNPMGSMPGMRVDARSSG